MIFFIDIEASSLGPDSYPIEIAWVDASGRGESHLIRPASRWKDWSEDSASVHRITRPQLRAEGLPVAEVAARAHAVLAGHEVYSDAAPWDDAWLAKLLEAGGRKRVSILDVAELHARACLPLAERLQRLAGADRVAAAHSVQALAARIIAAAHEDEGRRGGVRHRALPDAESNWRIWRAIQEGVREELERVRAVFEG
ncbi:3'-5' exonuclease [Roseomonas gilardii]|uniref:3'-5' exonuclease n=1 Tax=Roseomonas gilardii TaxID=257708 RepID=UPI000686C446|nr:hypothetical protein [Roseomonas gilardii]SUE63183.1 Uncharacterised protein [Roseomonas gilardii subsp. rosea]